MCNGAVYSLRSITKIPNSLITTPFAIVDECNIKHFMTVRKLQKSPNAILKFLNSSILLDIVLFQKNSPYLIGFLV